MIRIYPLALILLVSISTAGHTQNDSIVQKLKEIAIFDQKVMMPMRDGIRLATDIYRPKTDKPVPIIFY